MKFRPFLLLALVVVSASLTSCVKSYTCHCNLKYSGSPGLPDSTFTEFTVRDTKSTAKSKCEKESGTYDNNGIHTVETCYLY